MPDFIRPELSQHYEVDGDGPPLLLLAGLLSDSATWAPLVALLKDRFTVIRPDNRTTGRTAPWDAPVSVAAMAQDAIALMAHLGHAKFHVAGHSMGGLMALEIAGLVPQHVATAGVLASGRYRVPRTMAVFDALLAIRRAPHGEEMWLRGLYPWMFRPGFFEDPDNVPQAIAAALAYPHAQTADAMALQIEALRSFRPQTNVAELGCPIFVAYAGQDLLIPPDVARAGFQAIPDLTEVTIEDAGHSIVWDAPEELAGHMRNFLNAHPI
jgi:pimeloyl-ACP methyl ester carboxylesterase